MLSSYFADVKRDFESAAVAELVAALPALGDFVLGWRSVGPLVADLTLKRNSLITCAPLAVTQLTGFQPSSDVGPRVLPEVILSVEAFAAFDAAVLLVARVNHCVK